MTIATQLTAFSTLNDLFDTTLALWAWHTDDDAEHSPARSDPDVQVRTHLRSVAGHTLPTVLAPHLDFVAGPGAYAQGAFPNQGSLQQQGPQYQGAVQHQGSMQHQGAIQHQGSMQHQASIHRQGQRHG